MKKRLFNNISLKILALVLAIVVWLVVMNVDDPLVKKTITGITVELRNSEALTDHGYTYQVQSGSMVSITVRAPQSVASELKASDFVAYADLSQLSPLTDSASIEIECVKPEAKSEVKEISSRTQVVKLSIDNKVTQDVQVVLDFVGTPASDYIIGDATVSQNRIQVIGAASQVEKIVKAVIHCDVSEMTLSINEKVAPIFYDSEGNVVDVSDFTLSRKDLTLSVEILPTKWVGINVTPSGSVAEGYKMTGYYQNISGVRIAATASNLATITRIDLPSDAIVMNDITESTDYTVAIANFLPRSFRVVSDTKELTVHVKVEKLLIKQYVLSRDAIRVINLPEGYKVEIVNPVAEFELSALESVHENFNLDALNTCIDMKNAKTGTYEAILIMSESDNFSVAGKYSVTVKVTRLDGKQDTDDSEESDNGIKKR